MLTKLLFGTAFLVVTAIAIPFIIVGALLVYVAEWLLLQSKII